MSWHRNVQAQRDLTRNPEVPCGRCGYHYRARTGRMVATAQGWECTDIARCNSNIARQHWYREVPNERI